MTAKDRFDSHDRCGEEEIIMSSLAFHILDEMRMEMETSWAWPALRVLAEVSPIREGRATPN